MKVIYLDHAATTPVHPEVLQAMLPYFSEKFGNPSSLHQAGRVAQEAKENARRKIAECFSCEPKEIVFTSGGTEANNLAIFGVVQANKSRGNHIITSQIEHPAVLKPCQELEKQGYKVTYLPVDKDGMVIIEELKKAITRETILISIMYGNNEVGTIQSIEEIGQIAREYQIPFHTDAVQVIGKIKIDLKKLPIDLLSFSGHKIYGPKGIGGLFVRQHTRLKPLLYGGPQDYKRRAGTENIPGIIGLSKAIEIAEENLIPLNQKLTALRDRLENEIVNKIPDVQINGHRQKRLPHILNVSFYGIEGEGILLNLDSFGICVSTGSACSSESLEPSHVLTAMGVPPEIAQGAIRFSLGKDNTEADIDFTIECLVKVVRKLREISPLYHWK